MAPLAVLVAVVAFVGGIAMTVIESGLLRTVGRSGIPDVANVLPHAYWVIGGFVVAVLAAIVGHGYRCIGCDSRG